MLDNQAQGVLCVRNHFSAVLGGHCHIAELLLQNGANADAVDSEGASALVAAAAAGAASAPSGLLRRACIDDKMTALELAVQGGHVALEETLRAVLGRQERTISHAGHDAAGGTAAPSARVSFVEVTAAAAAEAGAPPNLQHAKSGAGVTPSFLKVLSTPRKREDPVLAALILDFGLPPSEHLLGRSVCTSQRLAPGVLSVTTSFVCFKPNAAGAGAADSTANPTLGAMLAAGASGGNVCLKVETLTRAERTKRWRKTAGKGKGYSIELTDRSADRYTFHGVLHCDLILQLLERSAAALGFGTRRDSDALFFLAPPPPSLQSAAPATMTRSHSAQNATL